MAQFPDLYFDKIRYSDIESIINAYDPKEFASASRSTIPLLSLVKDDQAGFRKILFECGLPDPESLHFEFTVGPIQGMGKASHTDLMVQSGYQALALEAKWTEPRYPTVAAWLKQSEQGGGSDSSNRKQVLNGWISLISSRLGRSFRASDFENSVYQMIHRAASACNQSKRPALAYLKFNCPEVPNSVLTCASETIRADLEDFYRLLGKPQNFPIFLVEIELRGRAVFNAISMLPKGAAETSTRVRTALQQSELFDFARIQIQSIP